MMIAEKLDICGVEIDPLEAYVHGNGFIQVPVDRDSRLHVWRNDVPCQTVDSRLHNHSFGFRSKVLYGILANYRYRVIEGDRGKWKGFVPVVRNGEDTELVELDSRFHVIPTIMSAYKAGESYTMRPGEFHISEPYSPVVVTLINKTELTSVKPKVICDRMPDNNFDRYAYQDTVMRILKEVSEL